MRKMFYLMIIFLISLQNIQAQNKLLFGYDTAGNQISRTLCINCPAGLGRKSNPNAIVGNQPAAIENILIDNVTFFPNPVAEELNIKWELMDNRTIESIAIYNLNGASLQTYNDLKTENSKTIPFGNYPTGEYIVNLFYNDGTTKNLNIIKK